MRSTIFRSALLLALDLSACQPDAPAAFTAPEQWTALGEHAGEALLAVGGRSETDVFAVGADKGKGPLVLHYDGKGWARLDTKSRGDLWWVHAFADGPVFVAGAHATILRYENETFTRMKTPGLGYHTVYGVWGSSPDDVYAVGSGSGRNGFVWHYDGKEWTDLLLPAPSPASTSCSRTAPRRSYGCSGRPTTTQPTRPASRAWGAAFTSGRTTASAACSAATSASRPSITPAPSSTAAPSPDADLRLPAARAGAPPPSKKWDPATRG